MLVNFSMLQEKNIGVLENTDCHFSSISTDTRKLVRGDVFVAIRGENFDGHSCVLDAEAKGAVGLIVERPVESGLPQLIVDNSIKALGKIGHLYRQQFAGRVVEITGSCGKTTVKGMLREICLVAGSCIATQGNFNNQIGVPLTLFQLSQPADFAVVEAGTSEVGEICYLTSIIDPDIALVNNVMPAHVQGFGSVEAIAEEKSAIYDCGNRGCISVVNIDDDYLPTFLKHINGGKIIAFGMQQKNLNLIPEDQLVAAVGCDTEEIDKNGCYSFNLIVGDRRQKVSLATVGRHNIRNAMAASACAFALGINIEKIAQGLASYTGDKGRMQTFQALSGAKVIDDSYNANPGSFKSAIEYLSQFKNSILVCGDMGELGSDAISLHEDIGRYAKNCGIARVYATGKLSAHLVESFGTPESFFSDKERLITKLKQIIDSETVVLVKGSRSAKMETVVEALRKQEEAQSC
ncbi:UDP-N-acetylmuramoyl-tripeptide--D-alanyl-D-alanine ligase [Thalassocella blandensis]|nr:UDP-N-acetylmuramoyl-tripeptide--D-alanyl-D-alanine ligase [Thalassocella blandensis]